MDPTRRRLLQLGGAAGLALAGGSALWMWGGGDHYRALLPEGVRPQRLSVKELAVLFTLVDRLLPTTPGFPTARGARVAERMERELAFQQPALLRDFQGALLVIEHGGVAHLSPTRFTKLSPEAQDARLEAMASGSDLERQAFNGLRVMATFFYYCDERTWPGIHYQGTLVGFVTPPAADSRVSARPG